MNAFIIGRNIKKLRDERCVTQRQLAESIGISFQAVSKWETGTTTPDVTILPEIARFFEISIDELFKPSMKAYRHKGERLISIYENTRSDDDFNLAKKTLININKLLKMNLIMHRTMLIYH